MTNNKPSHSLRRLSMLLLGWTIMQRSLCGQPSDVDIEKPSPQATAADAKEKPVTTRKDEEAFEVINDKKQNGGASRVVHVRIAEPVPEYHVERMACKVKESGPTGVRATRVFFLLPGMNVGEGAWASATFSRKPSPVVKVIGIPAGDYSKLAARNAGDVGDAGEEIVGVWLWDLGSLTHTMTVKKQGDKIVNVQMFPNGDRGEEEWVELEPRRKYAKKGDRKGEFMIINAEGHLEFWDRHGRAEIAHRVKQK